MVPSTPEIAGRPIGPGFPPYVVAELSANHLGSLDRAFAILEAAKKAGADALKLQTYTPDTMTLNCHGPGFDIEGSIWSGKNLYELYRDAQTPWEWHGPLFEKAEELGLTIFSSPFDISAVDFLERFDPPAYKIASFEATDLTLIRHAAGTGKPLVISTGLASREEIREAVDAARAAGGRDPILLHCVSGYPTPVDEMNLLTLPEMSKDFALPVGLSDHTLTNTVPIAATALGAVMIEKHFTLSRADGGPDAAFSIEPAELEDLVDACRKCWAALGNASYQLKPSERSSLAFRRSLYVVKDMEAGEVYDATNLRSIRPGMGLAPKYLQEIIGRRARRAIARGTPLDWSLVE